LLREKRLSALQRTALAQDLHRIETVLSAIDDQALHLDIRPTRLLRDRRAPLSDIPS
jgi:hypothetical protein